MALTLPVAERVLGDLITANAPRPITPKLILEATAEMFGFSVEELRGKSRRRPLVTARQIAMYVLREMTDLCYPAIAREFGDRDHTTVIHAVTKISKLMKRAAQIYDQVTELMTRLKTGALERVWTTSGRCDAGVAHRPVHRPLSHPCGSLGRTGDSRRAARPARSATSPQSTAPTAPSDFEIYKERKKGQDVL